MVDSGGRSNLRKADSSEIEWMTTPESSIGNRTCARACVVGHVLGSACTRNGTGHCGVAEDELEQQLSPTRDADLAGSRRQGAVAEPT